MPMRADMQLGESNIEFFFSPTTSRKPNNRKATTTRTANTKVEEKPIILVELKAMAINFHSYLLYVTTFLTSMCLC